MFETRKVCLWWSCCMKIILGNLFDEVYWKRLRCIFWWSFKSLVWVCMNYESRFCSVSFLWRWCFIKWVIGFKSFGEMFFLDIWDIVWIVCIVLCVLLLWFYLWVVLKCVIGVILLFSLSRLITRSALSIISVIFFFFEDVWKVIVLYCGKSLLWGFCVRVLLLVLLVCEFSVFCVYLF